MTFLYIFVFTKYVPPIQPRHSIHDINSTTNSTLPRSDYKGKVTVIHFYTSWGLSGRHNESVFDLKKNPNLGCIWLEWVRLNGFFTGKTVFFGSKAVGSTFRWEVIIHLVGFEWWPYLLWKVSNSPRKNSDQQQMRLEKCLTRQLPSVFVVFFCDHWELEMIHDDNSLHWP